MASEPKAIQEALKELIAEAEREGSLVTPRGYPHLGLAVLDAVFSLRLKYSNVEKILENYTESNPDIAWEDRFATSGPFFGAQELVDHLENLSSRERQACLSSHKSPGTKRLKAAVAKEVAERLVSEGVHHSSDLQNKPGEKIAVVGRAVQGAKGAGPATWRYILNLSNVEIVKPDTMVTKWVSDVMGEQIGQKEAGAALEDAAKAIQRRAKPTIRTIDHLVWRKASGRNLTAS